MSCRGNKSVQVKDAASQNSTKGNQNVDIESAKTENKQIPPGPSLKSSDNVSSKGDNKENIVERNTGRPTNATTNRNKERSVGMCRGDGRDVKTDVLTPVAPTKNVGAVDAQSSSKSDPKGNINNSEGILEDTIGRDTKSPSKKVGGGSCVGSSSVKTAQAGQGKVDENAKSVATGKNVKAKDDKGGLCSSRKSVEVKENKVVEEGASKHSVTTDNTKKRPSVSNHNEKTITEQSKEKAKTNEVNRKDSVSEGAVKQLTVGQKSTSANLAKDGNSSPLAAARDLQGQPIAEKKVVKSRLGLCCSGSSVNVKDTVTQKGQPVSDSALKTSNTTTAEINKEQMKELQKVDEDILDGEENSDFEEEWTESLYVPIAVPQKNKQAKKKKKKKTYVDDEPPARKKALAFASRKGKYSVSTDQEEANPMYASIKPNMKGNKKVEKPESEEDSQDSCEQEEQTVKKLRQDTPQKKKRKKGLDTNDELRSVYESQMASLQSKTFSNGEYTLTSQPTVEEEGDLLENAEEERKKNKQRLREKKKVEQVSPSLNADSTTRAYESAQREIDKVLGPRLSRESSETSHDRKVKEKSKKKKEKKGKDNEAFVPDEPKEESLEEARQRMHRLLDDAFSLISHSKSSISNKVQPVDSSDEPSSSSSKQSTMREDQSVQANLESTSINEKKHTPIKVRRTHEPYDSSGLITWSPYRASDEIAVISLPSTQTNLSSQPPQQEKLTTSTFVESAPPRKLSSYFATQPGEPIVIKTKSNEGSLPPTGIQTHQGVTGNSQHNSDTSRKHQETFQNPVYENTLPLRTMDSYSEPYHGLASYQDLPTSHLVETGRKVANGRPPVRQSAWQEERSKLGKLAPAPPASSSPRDTMDARGHTAPQRGERNHYDEVDVIKESLRPGASPQPFIDSLREELQTLSSKKQTNHTNGETKKMKSNGSESSWGSMHRNMSNI